MRLEITSFCQKKNYCHHCEFTTFRLPVHHLIHSNIHCMCSMQRVS